jgi:hypothetical protein
VTGVNSTAINSLGLIGDIVGAALLFFVGPPRGLSRVGALLLETSPTANARDALLDKFSYLGLGLLVAGFALQLISNYAR